MKSRILVDIERTKYPNTGLFTFCTQLMVSLKKYSKKYDYVSFGISKKENVITAKFWHKSVGVPSPKYDVWHITYQNSKYTPLRNIPIVLTIHDLNFLYTDIKASKKNKILKGVQKLIDKAAYVVVISEFVKQDVQKHCVVNKPIRVIHNGVDVKRFPNHKLKENPKKKFLYTIGTVLPKKNFQVLVSLLKNTDYLLIISGILSDVQYQKSILNKAVALGVEDRLIFTGAISEEDKYWYLKNCEAFLFPSLMEGFGLPVIEAMQLGKPVFISNKTCLPEIGGPHAYYFKNFEEAHMKEVLTLGLKDYYENNKALVIQNWGDKFTWNKAIALYEAVYEKVIDENSKK